MKEQQPDLHMPGWPECRYHGPAKTDGLGLWWYEETQPDGSIKRYSLVPYQAVAVTNGDRK